MTWCKSTGLEIDAVHDIASVSIFAERLFLIFSTPKAPLFTVKKVTREKFTTYCPDLWEKRKNVTKPVSHSRHKRKSPGKEGEKTRDNK